MTNRGSIIMIKTQNRSPPFWDLRMNRHLQKFAERKELRRNWLLQFFLRLVMSLLYRMRTKQYIWVWVVCDCLCNKNPYSLVWKVSKPKVGLQWYHDKVCSYLATKTVRFFQLQRDEFIGFGTLSLKNRKENSEFHRINKRYRRMERKYFAIPKAAWFITFWQMVWENA